MTTDRFAKAILVAPLSVYPIMVIPMVFSRDIGPAGLIIGCIAVMVAYAGMFVIGLPTLCVLDRYRATRWWQATLTGAVGGACMGWLVNGSVMSAVAASAAAFGALVAAVAWYIAFRRLPDQNALPILGKAEELP